MNRVSQSRAAGKARSLTQLNLHDQEPDVTLDPKELTQSGRRESSRPSNRLTFVATWVGTLSLVIRGSLLREAYFLPDDYMLSTRAVENEFTLDYLTRVHTGHFEPIGFAFMWVHAHYATFSWAWASVFLIVCQAVLLVMVWKLLVEMFGSRWLVLMPFTLFCFSPLTVAAFTFLAAGILWLPLMIATAGVMRYHVRYMRDGRIRDARIAWFWLFVGMASFEKIVIVLPFLVIFSLALEGSYRNSIRPTRDMLRRQRPIWIGYTALLAAYCVVYMNGARQAAATADILAPDPRVLFDYVFLTLTRTTIPGLFGGPWSWTGSGGYGLAFVDSPLVFDFITLALIFAVIMGSLLLRRFIALYWLSFLVHLVFAMSMVGISRVPTLGSVFGLETRYLADSVLPLVVVIGCCVMPLVGERNPLTAEGQLLVRPRSHILRWSAVVVTGLIVLVSLNSIARLAPFIGNNPGKEFLSNVRNGLAELPEGAQIVDSPVPGGIMTSFFNEYDWVSRFIAPLVPAEEREALYTRTIYTDPYVMDEDGSFAPMDLGAISASALPEPGWCWSNDNGTIVVPVTPDAYTWHWVVRIGYLSTSELTGMVALGGEPQPVPFNEGLGEVWVSLVGGGSELTVTGVPSDAQICIGDVTVGTPTPSPSP